MVPAIVVATVVGVALSGPLHQPGIGRFAAAVVLGAWLLYAIAYALRNRKASGESLLSIAAAGCAVAAVPAYLFMSASGVSMSQRAVISLLGLIVPAAVVFTNGLKAARRQQLAAQPAIRRR